MVPFGPFRQADFPAWRHPFCWKVIQFIRLRRGEALCRPYPVHASSSIGKAEEARGCAATVSYRQRVRGLPHRTDSQTALSGRSPGLQNPPVVAVQAGSQSEGNHRRFQSQQGAGSRASDPTSSGVLFCQPERLGNNRRRRGSRWRCLTGQSRGRPRIWQGILCSGRLPCEALQ